MILPFAAQFKPAGIAVLPATMPIPAGVSL